MILFGHRFIESEFFYHVESIDAIQKTPPSSTLYIEFGEMNLDIIKHSQSNKLPTAIKVVNITELIYAIQLGASYIVCSKEDAKSFQTIAEEYLFDAKILAIIENEEEIERLAKQGIDGVLFPSAIVKVTS
jgi:hypothetical protein